MELTLNIQNVEQLLINPSLNVTNENQEEISQAPASISDEPYHISGRTACKALCDGKILISWSDGTCYVNWFEGNSLMLVSDCAPKPRHDSEFYTDEDYVVITELPDWVDLS